ncbi:unnamed protein product [Penicillium pancosmium]
MEVNSPHNVPSQANSRASMSISSDPRLKRPRPPLATSPFPRHSQNSQPSSPTTTSLPAHEQARHPLSREASALAPRIQSDPAQKIDGFDLSGLLLEFVDARASRMVQIQERTKLEREESSYQRELVKARQTKSFPATIESLEADAAACKNRLAKINHIITQHQTRSTELHGDIGKLLRQTTNLQTPPATGPVETTSGVANNMARLEDDVRKIKRTILIKKEDDLPDKPIDIFKVCNTVESQSKAHTTFRKSINAIEEWRSTAEDETKQFMEAITQQTQERASSRQEIDQLTGQVRKTTEALSDLKNSLQAINQTVQRHENSVCILSADQKNIGIALSTQREQLEYKLAVQEQNLSRSQGQALSDAISDVAKKFDHTSQRIDALNNSDQERAPSSESSAGLRERVSDHDKRLIKMKEDWDDLLRRVPALYEASEEVKKCKSMVTQIAHVIQEMYPSARQLNEEVVALRNSVNRDIPGIKTGTNWHLDKIQELQAQYNVLRHAFSTCQTECLNTASASKENNEASTTKSNELEAQLQDLKTQLEATRKFVDELRIQSQTETPAQSSPAEKTSATQAQEICGQMRAMLDKTKSEMVDLLADVNSLLSSQSTALADGQEPSRRNQNQSQELESALTNKSSAGSRGSESTTQPPLRHSQPVSTDPLRQSSARIQHNQASGVQQNGGGLPSSPLKTVISSIYPQAHPMSAAVASNKRLREECSDDDSPSAAATTSESPAPSSNPNIRIGQRSLKRKKKKKTRQNNLGAQGF